MENNATLYHHGIKGQRWGVRRFQTKDGGLTSEGRKRYSLGETIHNYKVKKKRKAAAEKAREAKAAKAEHEKKAVAGKVDLKDMTDDEIRKAIARKQLENAYNQLHPKQVSKGEAFVKGLMNDVIKPAATTAGKNFLTDYLNKLGKDVLKDPVDANSIDALKDKYTKLDYKKKIMDLEDAIKNPGRKDKAELAKEAEYDKKILDYEEALDRSNKRKAADAAEAAKEAEAKKAEDDKNAAAKKAEAEKKEAAKKAEAEKKATAQKEKEEKDWSKAFNEELNGKKSTSEKGKSTSKSSDGEPKATKLKDSDVEVIPPDNDWVAKYNNYMNSSSAKAATSSFVNSEASTAVSTITSNTTSIGQSFVAGLLEDKG